MVGFGAVIVGPASLRLMLTVRTRRIHRVHRWPFYPITAHWAEKEIPLVDAQE